MTTMVCHADFLHNLPSDRGQLDHLHSMPLPPFLNIPVWRPSSAEASVLVWYVPAREGVEG